MNLEQAVTVTFKYGLKTLKPLHELEKKVEKILSGNNVGEYDGHEIATDYSDGFLFFYGPDAEKLFKAIKSILEETTFLKGAKVNLKFGSGKEDTREIDL